MTFADLTPSKDDLYKTNETSLASYSDDEIVNLYLDIAKQDVKMDLQTALNLDVSDSTMLDNIVETHQETILKAIAKKQLYYFYSSIDDGEGSYANRKSLEYKQSYSSYKSYFAQFKSKVTSKIMTVSAWC